MDTLKTRINEVEAAGGLHLDGLKQGDSVKIKSGPFAGYDAIFDLRLSGKDRVQVLLHWMGREMKVKLNANGIEKRRRRR
jgi:transcriptional antiterminator RfaH